MKWKLILYSISITLLFFLSLSHISRSSTSQTHSLDTRGSDGRYFRFDNDCGLWFDAETIYFGDSEGLWSWIDDNGVKFRNLRMGDSDCPNPWTVTLSSVNATVTKLFESNEFKATISASSGVTSTTKIYCGDQHKPAKFYINDHEYPEGNYWSYETSTDLLIITWTHSSDATVKATWKSGSGGLGLFNLHILVNKNGLPTPCVININNANHTTVGWKTLQLPYGMYIITVYCDGEAQTKTVGLYDDTSVGFNFETAPSLTSLYWLIGIPILFIIGISAVTILKKK